MEKNRGYWLHVRTIQLSHLSCKFGHFLWIRPQSHLWSYTCNTSSYLSLKLSVLQEKCYICDDCIERFSDEIPTHGHSEYQRVNRWKGRYNSRWRIWFTEKSVFVHLWQFFSQTSSFLIEEGEKWARKTLDCIKSAVPCEHCWQG